MEGRDDTWINPQIERLFTELHDLGYAHSVECRLDGVLVGGLYGVALGGAFFGESMFSFVSDASKVALVHLVARLRLGRFRLLDTQFVTAHLTQFGAREIPAACIRRNWRMRCARRHAGSPIWMPRSWRRKFARWQRARRNASDLGDFASTGPMAAGNRRNTKRPDHARSLARPAR